MSSHFFSTLNCIVSQTMTVSFFCSKIAQFYLFVYLLHFIEIQLIHNVVLMSPVQKVIQLCIYIYILFHILFHYGLSQGIEYGSLCCAAGPCSSVLRVTVGTAHPKLQVHPLLLLPLGNHRSVLCVCEYVSILEICSFVSYFSFHQ